jgi:hypothetical protein
MTPIRGREKRNWRPLWLWLLDVSAVNAYLIWKEDSVDSKHRGQFKFREELVNALMNMAEPPLLRVPTEVALAAQIPAQGHCPVRWKKPGYYAHCKTDPTWRPGHALKRAFGDVLDANLVAKTRRKRGSRVMGGCAECGVHLCVTGTCFDQWHTSM